MKSLIRAITRDDVPPSVSPPSPLPKLRSPSSMTSAIGLIARMIFSTRSRLDSVDPTHFERKFFSTTPGSPASFRNALMTKVLPTPIGPTASSPIGASRRSPVLIVAAIFISSCLI